ncbi:hypothetical protein JOQ06_024332, partial [Pogonophryne albipinna]
YMQWFDSSKMEGRRRWISSRESEGVVSAAALKSFQLPTSNSGTTPFRWKLNEVFEGRKARLTDVSIGNEKQIPRTLQGDLKKLLKSFRLSNDSAGRKTQSSYVRCARNNKSASSLNSSQLHRSQVSSSERARSHRGRDDAHQHPQNEAVSDDVCCGEPITVCDRHGTLYGFKEKRREKGRIGRFSTGVLKCVMKTIAHTHPCTATPEGMLLSDWWKGEVTPTSSNKNKPCNRQSRRTAASEETVIREQSVHSAASEGLSCTSKTELDLTCWKNLTFTGSESKCSDEKEKLRRYLQKLFIITESSSKPSS